MSRLSVLATAGLLAAQCAASSMRRFDSLEPFYDRDPMTPADCNLWWNSDDGLSCDTALLIVGVSVNELIRLNPSMKSCSDWKADRSYCLKAASSASTPAPVTTPAPVPNPAPTTTKTTTATTRTPTKPDNGVKTPEPFQPGMVNNCNRFYKVNAGETCSVIANKVGVTVTQLATWNTQIGGTACTGIWAGYNICTGLIGGSPTRPPPINPTPQPIQDGMVNNCNRFHLVKSGETCVVIASKTGVTVAQLAQWNKGIGGTACTGMWAGYHLCTGVSGGSQTQPPPTNPTPQPIQAGMVANCKKFHLVKSGQNCDSISRQYSITLANFIRWNPAAGSNCQGLWANTYACVGL